MAPTVASPVITDDCIAGIHRKYVERMPAAVGVLAGAFLLTTGWNTLDRFVEWRLIVIACSSMGAWWTRALLKPFVLTAIGMYRALPQSRPPVLERRVTPASGHRASAPRRHRSAPPPPPTSGLGRGPG